MVSFNFSEERSFALHEKVIDSRSKALWFDIGKQDDIFQVDQATGLQIYHVLYSTSYMLAVEQKLSRVAIILQQIVVDLVC